MQLEHRTHYGICLGDEKKLYKKVLKVLRASYPLESEQNQAIDLLV